MPFSKRSICTAFGPRRRHRVEHDDVGLHRHGAGQQVVAARLHHAVAARGQHVGQGLDRRRVLVDDEHALVRFLLLDAARRLL